MYSFQEEDLQILISDSDKSVLAYEMGLGKTYLALAYLKHLYTPEKYFLIITPLYLQIYWTKKIKEVTKLSCIVNASVIGAPGIYLLNYAKLKNKILKQNEYLISWDLIIVDEANYIKNPRTQRFKAFKKMYKKHSIKRILLLTGTPMQNNVGELWPLFYLSGGDKISYYNFLEVFTKRIKVPWGYKIIGIKNKELLQRALKAIMIRRLRKDVIDQLPAKRIMLYDIPMMPMQQRLYNEVREMLKAEVLPLLKTSGGNLIISNILVKMLRLKQIADDASLIDSGIPLSKASNKILALDNIFETLDKKGVFVFTQFKQFAKKIAQRYDLGLITGDVPVEERAYLLSQLNDKKIGLVATTQSVTYGIDVPGCKFEIFLDQLYNPKRMEQAQDRAYRITRKDDLLVVELHSENSIDGLIFKSGMNKIKTIKEVLKEK